MAVILLVEPNATNRRLFRYMLRQDRHNVVIVADGQQALAQLTTVPVDMVITRLHMPVMDGLTLLDRARARTAHADLPFVVFSESGYPGDRERALDQGANCFLTEPVGSQDLCTAVRVAQRRQPCMLQPVNERSTPVAPVHVIAAD